MRWRRVKFVLEGKKRTAVVATKSQRRGWREGEWRAPEKH